MEMLKKNKSNFKINFIIMEQEILSFLNKFSNVLILSTGNPIIRLEKNTVRYLISSKECFHVNTYIEWYKDKYDRIILIKSSK